VANVQTVEEGMMPEPPAVTREGYTFTGCDSRSGRGIGGRGLYRSMDR
jgi:hypothetical protein